MQIRAEMGIDDARPEEQRRRMERPGGGDDGLRADFERVPLTFCAQAGGLDPGRLPGFNVDLIHRTLDDNLRAVISRILQIRLQAALLRAIRTAKAAGAAIAAT